MSEMWGGTLMAVLEVISQVVLLMFLGVAALIDYKEKELPLVDIGAGFLTGFIFQCITGNLEIREIIFGSLVGVVVMGISKLTREAVGLGDGCMLVATGAFLGLIDNLILLMGALILAGAWSAGLLVIRRKNNKCEIPFVPFMLGGYVLVLAMF